MKMTSPFRGGQVSRSSLMLGPALIFMGAGVHAPAEAQCTSVNATTVCSSAGSPYSDGIAIASDGEALLSLEDGVIVQPDEGIVGIAVTAAGAATVASQGAVNVSTQGNSAAAVIARAGADAAVTLGNLRTTGVDATALDVRSGGRAVVDVATIGTDADRSPGMKVDALRSVSIATGSIDTFGSGAAAIIARSSGGIRIGASSIGVNGPAFATDEEAIPAVGIDAVSTGGDVDLTIGSVQVGEGNGVVATSYGGGVNVTVRGASVDGGVRTVVGSALIVNALSATRVVGATDTNPGDIVTYPVNGTPARAGTVSVVIDRAHTVASDFDTTIRLDSVKASTLINNGSIIRGSWPGDRAIEVSGGSATIANNGTLSGAFRLTASGDTFTNNGTMTTSYGRVDFDDNEAALATNQGVDTLINTGIIRVPTEFDFSHVANFANVEVFQNSGLIELRNGIAGDFMQFGRTFVPASSPGVAPALGQYIGSGNATIGLDLEFREQGALIDGVNFAPTDLGTSPLLVSGTTRVALNLIGARAPTLLSGLPVIYVPNSSTGTFVLAEPLAAAGMRYSLIYDVRQGAWALYTAPADSVLRQIKVPTNVQASWLRSGEVVSSHLRDIRDQRWTDARPHRRLWLQAVGDATSRTETFSGTINRIEVAGVDLSQRQTVVGLQGGVDTGGPEAGDTGVLIGATLGYLHSKAAFKATADDVSADSLHFGSYAALLSGSAFLNAAISFAHHAVDDEIADVQTEGKLRGSSYGVRVDAGLRLGSDMFFVEPSTSISYAVTRIGGINVASGRIAFDDLISKQGAAGVRAGGRTTLGGRELVYYTSGEAVHDFAGGDQARLTSGNREVTVPSAALGTFARGTLGANISSDSGLSTFIEGHGVLGKSYHGGGGRIGIRLPW